MNIRCQACNECFPVADRADLRGRLIKVRCRGCGHVMAVRCEQRDDARGSAPPRLVTASGGQTARGAGAEGAPPTPQKVQPTPLLPTPRSAPPPTVAQVPQAAARPAVRVEGSALIDIRQLAQRTLLGRPTPAREPSARFAIDALMGLSRHPPQTLTPKPGQPLSVGWVLVLVASAAAFLGCSLALGLVLWRYSQPVSHW